MPTSGRRERVKDGRRLVLIGGVWIDAGPAGTPVPGVGDAPMKQFDPAVDAALGDFDADA